jgi:hypothetical protein
MFLPALQGFRSKPKMVRLDSVGSHIATVSGLTITIDAIIDNLPTRPNSLLLVWVGHRSPPANGNGRNDITGVARNGTALTQVQAPVGVNTDQRFSLWRILNPTSTDGVGVVVSYDAGRDPLAADSRICLAWAYLYDVNQTVPVNAAVTARSSAVNPPLTANPLSGGIDRYPITAVFGSDTDGGVNWTSPTTQTRLHTSVTNNIVGAAIDTTTPNATTNFTITGQITNPTDAMMISINVNPA